MADKKKKNNLESEKKKKKNENKKGEAGKKDDGTITVVLKVNIHCDGCAKELTRSIKRFKGVEEVKGDSSTNKITVIGKVDPLKLREEMELKSKKKVELISPLPKKDKDAGEADKKKIEEKSDKKTKEPTVTTVSFKTRLHCEGCTKKIKKSISKIQGVEAVTIDKMQEIVTVKGTMEAKDLPLYLKMKLKRNVDIIQPKKEEKKEKTGGGEKKEKDGGGDEKKEKDGHVGRAVQELPGYGYVGIEYVHAPQYFSDENPNACSIM